MRKSTFTEEQIAYALRRTKAGTSVLEVLIGAPASSWLCQLDFG